MSQTPVSEVEVRYRPAIGRKPQIHCSQDAHAEVRRFFNDDTVELQEQFAVIFLNRAGRMISVYKASTGGMTATIVDIRLVLAVALKVAATKIIMVHNHPSGNLQPSQADIELTNKFKEACKFLDIQLLDHLILGPEPSYLSMAERSLLLE